MTSTRTTRRAAIAALAAATALGAGLVATTTTAAAAATSAVRIFLTTPDLSSRLTPGGTATLSPAGAATATIDNATRYQTIDGFGTAFTDTSASLIAGLPQGARNQVMSDLFSRTGQGIGLSFMRTPMGASDFTATPAGAPAPYSYDDGASDPTLTRFSTSHDDAYIIPVIKQAQVLNPAMKLFANPWSPPGWMKSNNSMIGSTGGQDSTLLPSSYAPLAQYFVKFLQDYRTKGVNVWGVTPQNEPGFAPSTYPGMSFPATDEARFIANNLAPALSTAGLNTKILGGDDIGASATYANTLFANSAATTALYGTAWHCYQGLGDMTRIHQAQPTKPVYETECSTGPTGIAGDTTAQTLISTNNWASGVALWNLALDPNGGPKIGQGCNGCTGLVTIDPRTGTYSYTLNYYELGQFSKFLAPSAQRVGSTDGNGVWTQAYVNPDGGNVMVAYNTTSSPITFVTNWKGQGNFSYSLPAGATATFTDSAVGTASSTNSYVGTGSGRCLDDTGSTVNGVQQIVYDCATGNANQRYTTTAVGELTIGGQCLGAFGNGTTDGTAVVTFTCNSTASQRWTRNADGSITNALSGLCLDVTEFGTTNGSKVQLWTCTGNTNQRWTTRT